MEIFLASQSTLSVPRIVTNRPALKFQLLWAVSCCWVFPNVSEGWHYISSGWSSPRTVFGCVTLNMKISANRTKRFVETLLRSFNDVPEFTQTTWRHNPSIDLDYTWHGTHHNQHNITAHISILSFFSLSRLSTPPAAFTSFTWLSRVSFSCKVVTDGDLLLFLQPFPVFLPVTFITFFIF